MICWIIFKNMIKVKKEEVEAKVGAGVMEEGIEIEEVEVEVEVEVGVEVEIKEKEEKKKKRLLIKKKIMDIIISLVMI